MAVTILYGNGLNRISGAPSWKEMMEQLNLECKLNLEISNSIPYSIQYDHLVLESNYKENVLDKLCQIMSRNWDNKLYHIIAERKDVNYITTNYDFTLEDWMSQRYASFYDETPKRYETVYNVRSFKMPTEGVKVWHIHGDINRPNSIILGYDHYCNQIHKIHDMLPFNKKRDMSTYNEILNQENSWVNRFFTDDIYIIGLGLSFEELDLWWLIDKWATFQKYRQNRFESPTNKIVYLDALIDDEDKLELSKTLEAYGIKYVPFREKTREQAYEYCIKSIPKN